MKPYCLDIDTDYLVIPRVISGGTDEHPALPWCWPEELVAKLRGAADSFLAKRQTRVHTLRCRTWIPTLININ